MKLLNKKVPVGIIFAAIFVVAALVYSLGYKMAMDKFNSVVSYTQEKQKMYSKLSDVDYALRKEYIESIDETKLINNLCQGYAKGVDGDSCAFFTSDEYKTYLKGQNPEDTLSFDRFSENIGYVRCYALTKGAADTFIGEINSMISDGLDKIIIDARNLNISETDEVFKILQYLARRGDIVSTVNKKGEREIVCKSSSEGVNFSLAILVNGKTTGVCELIPSALRGLANVKILGTPTAGNCVRKKIINMSDGSVLIFPDAHYVTPSGDVFFKKGVEPDIRSEITDEDLVLYENSALPYDKDNQIQAAISLLNS